MSEGMKGLNFIFAFFLIICPVNFSSFTHNSRTLLTIQFTSVSMSKLMLIPLNICGFQFHSASLRSPSYLILTTML
jgi:hypothetical protein